MSGDETRTIKVYLMVECDAKGAMSDRALREIAKTTVAAAIAKDSGNRAGEAHTFTWPTVQVLVRDPVELPGGIVP